MNDKNNVDEIEYDTIINVEKEKARTRLEEKKKHKNKNKSWKDWDNGYDE